MNDERGHEYGDRLIIDAALALKCVFLSKNVYRIGGDEFAAVLKDTPAEAVEGMFTALDENLSALNRERDVPLAISRGAACLQDGDREFNDVFRRADEAMFRDKAAYYAAHGDRRSR